MPETSAHPSCRGKDVRVETKPTRMEVNKLMCKRSRKTATVLLLFGLGASSQALATDETLKEDKDKASYSVGYKVGNDLKRQGIDFNPEALVKGINDALTGAAPRLHQEEMGRALGNLKEQMVAKQREEQAQTAKENLTVGKAFLAENGKKKDVVTLPSGLQYQIIVAGSGATPKANDSVTVHYRGTLIDGTEFDSSYQRNEPTKLQLDRVIPGWTEALQLMKEGAKWKLFVPPSLAYGERGVGPIPPNSTLLFEVELISVN